MNQAKTGKVGKEDDNEEETSGGGGGAKLIISDYVFPDETDADIGERIKQLFDYDITDPENEIVYVEDLPRTERKFLLLLFIKFKIDFYFILK